MLACKMLLEQFLHFLRGWGTPQANGVVMNVHPLMALAIYLVGLGYYDFLNELVDDFRRQLRQPSHLSGPLNNALYDFSYAEIAEMCSCTKGSVQTSINAVRKTFQKFWK